jgi:hypothetical protein
VTATSTSTAGEARDDDVEDGDDSVDDSLENGTDSVDDSHQGSADGAEHRGDLEFWLVTDIVQSRARRLTQDTTAPIVFVCMCVMCFVCVKKTTRMRDVYCF